MWMGAHGLPASRVYFEVQVRVGAVGVARVADVGNLLPGRDLRSARDGVGSPLDALAAVVVSHREVIVQMDVVVGRPALAVEVEHATGGARGRSEERRVGKESRS